LKLPHQFNAAFNLFGIPVLRRSDQQLSHPDVRKEAAGMIRSRASASMAESMSA
jgi:hypothetical protein